MKYPDVLNIVYGNSYYVSSLVFTPCRTQRNAFGFVLLVALNLYAFKIYNFLLLLKHVQNLLCDDKQQTSPCCLGY